MKDIYISIDVETDGPIPGRNSMLSFGAAAFIEGRKTPIGTFSRNLEKLYKATPDEKTMSEFWDKNPEAWEACRENIMHPETAMLEFVEWVNNLKGKPVIVAYPTGFDFMFIYWYLMAFVGKSPFSFSCIDIKTYACAMLKKSYRNCSKRGMPKRWFPNMKHTHIALGDAIEQGMLFMNMLKENKENAES